MALEIHSAVTMAEFRAAAGYRIGDPSFDEAYSNLTPETEEGAVKKWQDREWIPFFVRDEGRDRVWHYAHDTSYDDKSAWLHGFAYPEARGRSASMIAYRYACCLEATDWLRKVRGFQRIFSYVMRQCPGAIHWNEVCCQYHRVGVRLQAVPENEGMADIIVYSQRLEDAAVCRRQVEVMFPGEWERPQMPGGVAHAS